jgi:hypothetical protein
MNAEPIDDIAAQLFACERALLDPAVRRDRAQVSALLADDFIEFGSSGAVRTRNAIVDLLESEDFTPPEVVDFACRRLGEGVMLVTYRTVRFGPERERTTSLRSSIWSNESGNWLLRFHQGTRAD